MCVDITEKDSLKARKRSLKAENKELQKENAILKARLAVDGGFRNSTMRIQHHINQQVRFFEEKDQALSTESKVEE